VNTVAKLKAATCQNQTLVKQKPTPSASRPANDRNIAHSTTPQARQYAAPPCTTRRSARAGLKISRGSSSRQ
jgi:hypothetical protein